MKLRTLHQRKRQSRIGKKAFEALKFCNHFAGNFYIKHSRISAPLYCFQVYKANFSAMSNWDYTWAKKRGYAYYYAGDLFYQLKNRLLAKYGKSIGYALQVWDSDYWDEEGFHEFKEHKHILEIIRIKGFDFHQPTGHFHFLSDDDYSAFHKYTLYFEEFEKLCGNNFLRGKKEIKLEGGSLREKTNQFHIHLRYLLKKFRPLLMRPFNQPKLEIVTYRNDYYEEHCQQQRILNKENQLTLEWEF